jgi:hypothetical protein
MQMPVYMKLCDLKYFSFFDCSLNILLAGSDAGQLAMYAYGVVHLVQLDLAHLGIDNVSYYRRRKMLLIEFCFLLLIVQAQ